MSQTEATSFLAYFSGIHLTLLCAFITLECVSQILQVFSQTFTSLKVRKKQLSCQICFFEVEFMLYDIVPGENKCLLNSDRTLTTDKSTDTIKVQVHELMSFIEVTSKTVGQSYLKKQK